MSILSPKASRLTRLMVSFLSVVISQNAFAVDMQELTEEDFFMGDVPIVLTGSRLIQERSEVPGSITIIDRAMIEASGTREIPKLLRLVPGFQVAHTKNRIITAYHGNSDEFSRRMQVLIDGRSIYTGVTGGVEWYDIPLSIDDIERIEVFRGPNAVSYGSNAFVAVVNIITRHPSTLNGIDGAIDVGQEGYSRNFVRKSGKTDEFSYRLTAETWKDDGLLDVYDSKKRSHFNFFGEYRPNIQDTFEVMFGYSEGFNNTGDDDADNPLRNEYLTSHYQQVRWKRQLSTDEEIKLQFYHNYHLTDDEYGVTLSTADLNDYFIGLGAPAAVYVDPVPTTFSLSNVSDRYNIDYEHSKRMNKDLRLVWGAEARLTETGGLYEYGLFNTEQLFKRRTYRAFIDSEWQLSQDWLLNTGIMFEKDTAVGSSASPRVALNYKINPQQSLRFVTSKATRVPSVLETDANARLNLTLPRTPTGIGIGVPTSLTDTYIKGNEDLKSEKITSYELGYYAEFFQRKMLLDVKLYREEITDIVVFHKDNTFLDETIPNGIDTFANDGYQTVTGLEMGLELQPTDKTRLLFNVAYAKQDGVIRTRKNEDSSLVYVETDHATPQYTSSALLIQKLDSQTEFSAGYYKVSTVTLYGGDRGAYSTADLRLARNFKTQSGKGKVEFVLQNAFGEHFDYDDHFLLKKAAFLSVSVDFD